MKNVNTIRVLLAVACIGLAVGLITGCASLKNENIVIGPIQCTGMGRVFKCTGPTGAIYTVYAQQKYTTGGTSESVLLPTPDDWAVVTVITGRQGFVFQARLYRGVTQFK